MYLNNNLPKHQQIDVISEGKCLLNKEIEKTSLNPLITHAL